MTNRRIIEWSAQAEPGEIRIGDIVQTRCGPTCGPQCTTSHAVVAVDRMGYPTMMRLDGSEMVQ